MEIAALIAAGLSVLALAGTARVAHVLRRDAAFLQTREFRRQFDALRQDVDADLDGMNGRIEQLREEVDVSLERTRRYKRRAQRDLQTVREREQREQAQQADLGAEWTMSREELRKHRLGQRGAPSNGGPS